MKQLLQSLTVVLSLTFSFSAALAVEDGAASRPAPMQNHSVPDRDIRQDWGFYEPVPECARTDAMEPKFAAALDDFDKGRYEKAAEEAALIATGCPGTPWEGRADFLAGRALGQAKDVGSAQKYLLLAVERYPVLSDYALYLLAGYLNDNARFNEAAEIYLRLAREHPKSPLAPESVLNAAELLQMLGKNREAVDILAPLMKKPSAKATSILIAAYAELGKFNEAFAGYRSLWTDFPSSPQTAKVETLIKKLKAKGLKTKPFDGSDYLRRADSYYHKDMPGSAAEEYREALRKLSRKSSLREDAFLGLGMAYLGLRDFRQARYSSKNAIMNNPSKSQGAEAWSMLARIYLREGNTAKFREAASACAKEYPKEPKSIDILYTLGVVLSQEKEYGAALGAFKRLLELNPEPARMDEVLWQTGWIFYCMGDYGQAAKTMGRLAKGFPRSSLAPQGIYWEAEALQKEGALSSAYGARKELLEKYPDSFYAILLAEGKPAVLVRATDDIASLPEPRYDEPEVNPDEKDPRLARVCELGIQGMKEKAEYELAHLDGDYAGTLDGLKKVTELHNALGEYRRPLELALQAYNADIGSGDGKIPEEALRLLYPLNFWNTIYLWAAGYKIDPWLLCAVIREESHYRPDAVSPAGAVGLMQLMTGTADIICKKLNISGTSKDDLKNCDYNIPLGAYYLSSLVRKWNGRLAYVMAEYNAGADSLKRWIDKDPSAPDDRFIESIDYAETRGYVKRVMRNYFMYKKLYEEKNADVMPPSALSHNP